MGLASRADSTQEVERVRGIEPPSFGWEPKALPLSYTRPDRIRKSKLTRWILVRDVIRITTDYFKTTTQCLTPLPEAKRCEGHYRPYAPADKPKPG